MTKRVQSKFKISRRLGHDLWGRGKRHVKIEQRPGMHGQKRTKPTDYGIQLYAKQRLKGYYGNITERQFRKIYEEASRRRGDTSENLIGLLEQRLDAVVYRMKVVPTVFAARQFVNHGHIRVNGRRVNIPSYQVKPGDVIEVAERSRQAATVISALDSNDRDVPDYIELDQEKRRATFTRVPKLGDVPYPVKMEPNLVVEYYSR
jgi:small subunit ribosomal protein S4